MGWGRGPSSLSSHPMKNHLFSEPFQDISFTSVIKEMEEGKPVPMTKNIMRFIVMVSGCSQICQNLNSGANVCQYLKFLELTMSY